MMPFNRPDIAYIDMNAALVVLANGAQLPIVRYLDSDGDDCDPNDEDLAEIVAGPYDFPGEGLFLIQCDVERKAIVFN